MEHLELINLLTPELGKLGYIQVDENGFALRMNGFVIVSNVVSREKLSRFDIVFGIIFTQTTDIEFFQKCSPDNAIIESSWYQLLLNSGESAVYLDKLFYFDRNGTTASDIKEKLPVIIDLFQSKVMPSFEKWNDTAWLLENFEEEMYLKKIPLYAEVESCLKLIRQQIGVDILSGIASQEQSDLIDHMESPSPKRNGNLYNFLQILEQPRGRSLLDLHTFKSVESFIKGYLSAAEPDQLELQGCPNFTYFDKWLRGHLAGDVNLSISWSTLILERNVYNDEKAFEEFFHFIRIFKMSEFTGKGLIVEADIKSNRINRWLKINEKFGIKNTFYKIRWMQLSNSSSIWIDYLDISDKVIDGEWYLNEQQAKKALIEEYGDWINDWFKDDIA